MQAAKFEMSRTQVDGKNAFNLTIYRSMSNPELHALVDSLGYKAVEGVSNCRRIVVTNQAELDAARGPLVRFFDADGNAI